MANWCVNWVRAEGRYLDAKEVLWKEFHSGKQGYHESAPKLVEFFISRGIRTDHLPKTGRKLYCYTEPFIRENTYL
jgi:hypothetical protein